MGVDSFVYKLVLLLHILAAIVGIGTVFLNGVRAAWAQREGGARAAAVTACDYHVNWKWAEKFIYSIFVFGVLLIVLSDGVWEFDQMWISLSFLVYIVAIGISHGLLRPAERRLVTLSAELAEVPSGGARPPQLDAMESAGKRAAAAGTVLDILVIVLLYLMIWKPGV